MKFVFYLLVIVCTGLFSVNASAQYWDWVKTQQGLPHQRMASDGVSKVYMHGGFTGTVNMGNTTLTSANPHSAYVALYDTLGNVLWAKSVAFGNNMVFPNDIDVDSSGNVYLCGTYFNTGDTVVTVYLQKYDATGNQVWSQTYKLGQAVLLNVLFSYYAELYEVAADNAGNVFLTGHYDRVFTVNSDVFNIPDQESFLMKFNSWGGYLWGSRFGSTMNINTVLPQELVVDNTGNPILLGWFHGVDTLTFGSYKLIVPGKRHISHPNVGMFVAKYENGEGKALWAKANTIYDTVWGSRGKSVAVSDVATDSHGDIYICGVFDEIAIFDNVIITDTATSPTFELGSHYLVKYSSGGVAQWGKNVYPGIYQGTGGNPGSSIAINVHDEIFVEDERTGRDNWIIENIITKHDRFGGQDWQISVFGNPEFPQTFWDICTDAAHNLYVAGQLFTSAHRMRDTIFLGHHGIPDQKDFLSFRAKIIPGVTFPNRVETVSGGHGLQVFPNPFTQSATLSFHFQQGHDYNLVVTDISGRIVSQKEHLASGEVFIARGDLLPGVYIAQLKDSGKLIGTQKLIVQ